MHENVLGTFYTATARDYEPTVFPLHFSLVQGTGDNELFSINAGTGELAFKTATASGGTGPDFENPADANKDNVYAVLFSVTDVAGNTATKSVSVTVTDRPEDYTDAYTGMAFEKVQKGTFIMGCTTEQGNDCYKDEKPPHYVTLTQDYFMGKYEVTHAQWRKVMGSNPPGSFNCDNCPVEKVSWNDVQGFIAKLNAELKKAKSNIKLKYRLPTEAEWEYAARGGHKATFTKYAGSNTPGNVAWYKSNSNRKKHFIFHKAHPVGQKAPNELGLYDMSGNVPERCLDWYGYYSRGAKTDPKGPSTGRYRVLRGGSWGGSARFCRVSSRDHINPGLRNLNLGFRLCLGL